MKQKNVLKALFVFSLLSSITGVHAQPIVETIEDKAYVYYNGMQIEMESHLEIPESEEPLQRQLSLLLFGQEATSVKDAYSKFLKQWKGKLLSPQKEIGGFHIETIEMNIHKEYEKPNRFACYHIEAKVLPTTISIDLKANASQTAQLQQWKQGINKYFIYDLQKHEVLKMDQVFEPALFEKISSSIGKDASLYTEDWCVMFSSEKGDGRFQPNAVSAKHLTDYFKELIEWNIPKQTSTKPRFLRGERGLQSFFQKEGKYSVALNGEPADTVRLSLSINAEGSVDSIAVVSPATKYDRKAVSMCRKMPKWQPACQNGEAVSSTIEVEIPFLTVVGDEIPEYKGGNEELRRYIFRDLVVPSSASSIKENIILEFIIETDGSVTFVRTRNSSNEGLRHQFISKLERMPKWKPAKKNGKPIRCKQMLPIQLNMTDDPNWMPED